MPKQMHRKNITVDKETEDKLDELKSKTQNTHSKIIRKLVKKAKPEDVTGTVRDETEE